MFISSTLIFSWSATFGWGYDREWSRNFQTVVKNPEAFRYLANSAGGSVQKTEGDNVVTWDIQRSLMAPGVLRRLSGNEVRSI